MFEIENTHSTWQSYGLLEHDLKFNSNSVGFKAIEQNGKLVQITSRDYVLLPNEEAVKVAEAVAKDVGAVPFSEFNGDWYVPMNDHIIKTGKDGHQVHAMYAFNQPFEIGAGDTIQLGFAVHNSIDRSLGFGAGLFTFRHACANMVFMGLKGNEMAFDERKTLAWTYSKHVGNFNADGFVLQKQIQQIIEQGINIIDMYKHWNTIKLNEERFEILKNSMPAKYIPEGMMTQQLGVEEMKVNTMWNAYNSITEKIWHNDKTDYATKKITFDRLHQVMLKVGR